MTINRLRHETAPGAFTWCVGMIAIAAMLLAGLPALASDQEANYSGHYELADGKADRTFSLVVKQQKSRAEVTFSVAMADGSGAAPDGTGKGRIEDGVLSFAFKDSFDNEGTCTLEPAKGGYRLSMTVLKVVDPRPFHFYGNFVLKRAPDNDK